MHVARACVSVQFWCDLCRGTHNRAHRECACVCVLVCRNNARQQKHTQMPLTCKSMHRQRHRTPASERPSARVCKYCVILLRRWRCQQVVVVVVAAAVLVAHTIPITERPCLRSRSSSNIQIIIAIQAVQLCRVSPAGVQLMDANESRPITCGGRFYVQIARLLNKYIAAVMGLL